MLKGAIHIHSTYSDGEYTLAQLRAVLIDLGCRFACMTDHAEWFDQEKLKKYVAECAALSDAQFQFIAGLEYECERRMHILGFGVTSPVQTENPQEVISHIERAGGVSVIAHPTDAMFSWIETFDVLPLGIETWNSKYDGQHAPRPSTFRLLNRLQDRRPDMRAFYGQDLHWKRQPRVLFIMLEGESPARAKVLAALKYGAYTGSKDEYHLPSDGLLPEPLLEEFGVTSARHFRQQHLFKRVKKLSGRFGKSLPAPIKSRIRRIFS